MHHPEGDLRQWSLLQTRHQFFQVGIAAFAGFNGRDHDVLFVFWTRSPNSGQRGVHLLACMATVRMGVRPGGSSSKPERQGRRNG